MIIKCTCKHPGQDKLNGKQKRVYNETSTVNGKQPIYRCSVCLKEVAYGH